MSSEGHNLNVYGVARKRLIIQASGKSWERGDTFATLTLPPPKAHPILHLVFSIKLVVPQRTLSYLVKRANACNNQDS